MRKSKHDQERDRIAADWLTLPSFICDSCGVECNFPDNLSITTERRYADGLRADVGATGTDGRLIGVVEVIDTSRPTPRAFAEQSKMGFAYYRLLTPPYMPKSRNGGYYDNHKGRFDYSGVDSVNEAAWLCSGDCLVFYEQLKWAKRTNNWDAPRCDVCGEYLHDNPLSRVGFTDWAYDSYTVFCIHCAARCDASKMQWRSPHELAGGDPENGRLLQILLQPTCSWHTVRRLSGLWFGRVEPPTWENQTLMLAASMKTQRMLLPRDCKW